MASEVSARRGVTIVPEADVDSALEHRSFRLQAAEGLGAHPRPELIGPVLTSLHGSLLDAVRMGFLHSSRPRGRVPRMLKAAADVRYLGHDGDGDEATFLHFQVPTFGTVAKELFQQKHLWDEGPAPDETAFELFGAALRDVAARREDSSRFDPGLLRRIQGYARLLTRGVERISMPDTAAPRQGQIDQAVVGAAGALISVTPSPRRVRVAGRIDVMAASQRVLKLELRPGQVVTALWEGAGEIDQFHDLFNHDVAIEGTGVFRPSGSLLRIDADAIAPAAHADEFFRTMPFAPRRRDDQQTAHLKRGEASVYARLRGSIPPEESDEAFEAALTHLR